MGGRIEFEWCSNCGDMIEWKVVMSVNDQPLLLPRKPTSESFLDCIKNMFDKDWF